MATKKPYRPPANVGRGDLSAEEKLQIRDEERLQKYGYGDWHRGGPLGGDSMGVLNRANNPYFGLKEYGRTVGVPTITEGEVQRLAPSVDALLRETGRQAALAETRGSPAYKSHFDLAFNDPYILRDPLTSEEVDDLVRAQQYLNATGTRTLGLGGAKSLAEAEAMQARLREEDRKKQRETQEAEPVETAPPQVPVEEEFPETSRDILNKMKQN